MFFIPKTFAMLPLLGLHTPGKTSLIECMLYEGHDITVEM